MYKLKFMFRFRLKLRYEAFMIECFKGLNIKQFQYFQKFSEVLQDNKDDKGSKKFQEIPI